MHKLPVLATAGRAYGFLLGEFATILRLAWLAVLLMLIVQYVATQALYDAMRAALEARDVAGFSALATISPWQVINAVATILGTSIVAVALPRIVLFGDRQPGRYFHLALGKVELLFALLPILFFAAFAAIVFVGILGAATLPSPIFLALLGMSALVALVFLAIRLCLIFPVTVVEGRYDFGQAWTLTQGNFWRIVGLWVVASLPVWIVIGTVQYLMGGALDPGSPTTAALDRLEAFLIPNLAISFLTLIVQGALGVGLLSYCYKALNGLAPEDVLSPRS